MTLSGVCRPTFTWSQPLLVVRCLLPCRCQVFAVPPSPGPSHCWLMSCTAHLSHASAQSAKWITSVFSSLPSPVDHVLHVFCLICPVDRVLGVLSHLSSGPYVRCSVTSVQWNMCYTGVLSPLSSGPCVTWVFCCLCPVDHVLHRVFCRICPVDHVLYRCSVSSVHWTMCYPGVLSIGPCVPRCSVTSVQCTLWYTGVLSSGPCDTHTFCHICQVDHVVHRCSVTCVHSRSVISVQWTMCYSDILCQLMSNSPCVCYIGFSVHLCQWTMCVT